MSVVSDTTFISILIVAPWIYVIYWRVRREKSEFSWALDTFSDWE